MNQRIQATVETVDTTAGSTRLALKTATVISGSEAFRKYKWIANAPVRNSAGNFRGMVLSSRWKIVYHFTDGLLKPVEKVAGFAALAASIVKAKDEVDQILASQDNWAFKGARLSAQVTSVCLRTTLGDIPFGADVIAFSLGRVLGLADMAGLHRAANWNRALQSLDMAVDATFDKVTDGNNIYLAVNKLVLTR